MLSVRSFVRDHDHNICAGMCQALRQIDVLGDESRMVRVVAVFHARWLSSLSGFDSMDPLVVAAPRHAGACECDQR